MSRKNLFSTVNFAKSKNISHIRKPLNPNRYKRLLQSYAKAFLYHFYFILRSRFQIKKLPVRIRYFWNDPLVESNCGETK